jgi:hypothetical protein
MKVYQASKSHFVKKKLLLHTPSPRASSMSFGLQVIITFCAIPAKITSMSNNKTLPFITFMNS